MHSFPHTYKVSAHASSEGDVVLSADALPNISSQPPLEFDGPGDRWSPESLLMAAIADCFTLSFRAIAAASKISFNELSVDVDGELNMVERKMLFTDVKISASLVVPDGVDPARAERLLTMAEQSCLVTNSLNVECHLSANVRQA